MSQRNPMNERYQKDSKIGSSRKSAASAKPKNKAAASVTVGTKKKTPQERKAEQKKARKEAQERQRELDRKYYKPNTKRYQNLRKLWWFSLAAGIICVVIAYLLREVEPTWMATAALILAYALILFSFYIDFSKIRKERRAYQQKMLLLEQMQEKKARQKQAEENQGYHNKSRKKGASAKQASANGAAEESQSQDAEQATQDGASEGAASEGAASKVMGFFRKKAPKADDAETEASSTPDKAQA